MPELSLEIVEGPGSGQHVELTRAVDIGRDPSADFQLDDQLVSRRHARIEPVGDGAIVEDLDSLNGTFVNGEEVHARTQIKPGDDILVGVTVLELRSREQVSARPTAVRPKPPPLARPPSPPDYIPPALDAERSGASELDSLLDIRTKAKARLAPLALFLVVAFAVLIFLATR